jgi:hypothetical protein
MNRWCRSIALDTHARAVEPFADALERYAADRGIELPLDARRLSIALGARAEEATERLRARVGERLSALGVRDPASRSRRAGRSSGRPRAKLQVVVADRRSA